MAVKVWRRYLHWWIRRQQRSRPGRTLQTPRSAPAWHEEGTTLKKTYLVAGAAALVGVLAVSSGASAAQHYLITSSSQIKNGTISLFDLTPDARKALKGHKGDKGDTGAQGARGPQGPKGPAAPPASPVPGPQGPKGDDGILPAGFTTSASATVSGGIVTVTPVTPTMAGLGFGPYADGGTAGGSVIYDGVSGKKLSDLTALTFTAKYSTDDHTDVGVPYLRVFFTDGSVMIYSPNTQPVKDTAEGQFHTWNVRTGPVRIDDDKGNGADMPFADAATQLAPKTISFVKVSAGFSAGQNLRVTLSALKVG